MRRRVVVTGIGMITSLGHNVAETWRRMNAGESGVGRISLFDASEFPTKIAGEVRDFNLADFGEDETRWRHSGRNTRFALVAAKEAVADSGLAAAVNFDPDRTGVYMGAGEGGQDFPSFVHLLHKSWKADGSGVATAPWVALARETLHPLDEREQEPGMVGSHLAERFGVNGPNFNSLTACAASSQAIGEATSFIRAGDADVMLAGGAHSMIHAFGVTGFNRLTALSTNNEDPTKASRPFDAKRDGFVLGEGSGMVVLEELEHARARGARIYGELLGYGTTADAFRVTDQHPEGRGGIACMRNALRDAGLQPTQIQYINAHGTSTDVNDRVETLAIKEVFGEAARSVPISSIKSMTGHLIAAAGSVEFITCLLAIRDDVLPPTINYENPDPDCDLDYVPNVARAARVDNALSNSFGFGGQNVSLVVGRYLE